MNHLPATIAARMYSPFYDNSLEDPSAFSLGNVDLVKPVGKPRSGPIGQ